MFYLQGKKQRPVPYPFRDIDDDDGGGGCFGGGGNNCFTIILEFTVACPPLISGRSVKKQTKS